MRLKLVAEVDFRKSEVTNWALLAQKGQVKHVSSNEVVCLVNKKRTQIVFVSAAKVVEGARHREINIVHSRRLRITSGGSWNPLMLSNYASEVGIELARPTSWVKAKVSSQSVSR
jgi:hypothetical protein